KRALRSLPCCLPRAAEEYRRALRLAEEPIHALDGASEAALLVDVDEDAVELHGTARDLEAVGHAVDITPDDDRRVDAEHRVTWPDHARVRDVRRAPRQHARVGGGHVRVRADHRGDAAVEVPADRDLLARRLGVPVDDLHLRRAIGERVQDGVDGAERVVNVRRHEDAPDRVHHEHVIRDDPPTSGIARREVDRSYAVLERVDVLHELPLIPHVVAVRDHVGAGVVDLARDVRSQARPARGVLAVHDGHVDAQLALQLRKERRDRVTARAPHHITDEEDAQGLSRQSYLAYSTDRVSRMTVTLT